MSRTLRRSPRLANQGSPRTIRAGALESADLNAGNEVTIWSVKVPADKMYAHGAGTDNRESGRDAFGHADINGDDGAGATVDVTGDLVAVITDSEQRDVLARVNYGDIETLADAANDPRTERPQFPALEPLASEDRHLELRVVADDSNPAATVDPAASDVRLYYTDIPR